MEHVERIGRTLVRKGSILDIYDDEMKLPDGSIEHWEFVSHRKGAAAVVAVLPDGRILLVHQYRPALDRYTWELPAGCRDFPEEDTKVCAERELKEETGCVSDRVEKLLSLKTTVAFCNELVDVYLALDIRKEGGQDLDPAEVISLKAFPMDELLAMIGEFTIQDAKTVAGVLAYKAWLEKNGEAAGAGR